MAISTDTRSIKPGDIFLPLIGENFDGHNFLYDALKAGASQAYSEKDLSELPVKDFSETEIREFHNRIIKVSNTLDTYHKLANDYRKKINPITIGITGSSGKTTTKEMLRHILAQKYKVHFSQANFNNEIGVPKTILSMPEDTEVLILEMGMRGLGEIELLSKTAEPDYAIITNIGTAHIERLGSRENIRKAKLEIAKSLKKTLVVDENLLNDLKANKLMHIAAEILSFNAESNYKINGLAGSAIHSDANAAALLAKKLGLSDEQIQEGLNQYKPDKGRGSFHYDNENNLFIDDSYNANPESVRASVTAMLQAFPDEEKIIVIGALLESKAELINELFEELKALQNKHKFTLINASSLTHSETHQAIKDSLTENKTNVVLLKASRGAQLEKVLELFNIY